MQGAARKQLLRCFWILVVPLGAYVAEEYDLADLLAVPRYVNEHALGLVGADDTNGQAGHESVALAGHVGELLLAGEGLPGRHMIGLRERPVGFGHPIDVDRVEIEGELLALAWSEHV